MSRNLRVALLCVLAGLSVSLTAATCSAQRVRVGDGVHVRAPFVRVDVYPYGGVSVRAPFTAVDIPDRVYYDEPRFVELFPSDSELAAMDDAELGQALRSISARLHERLSRFDTGASWQRYLRLPETAFAYSSSERREALVKTLDRFDHVASDPQYSMVARLPALVAMQAALTEALSRLDKSPTAGDSPSEDLPLPAPDRPVREGRNRPFLQPSPRP